MLYAALPHNAMLDVHIKTPKPMKYVPAQLSSFLRCNKIEKCLFRLSGLFGLAELNSPLPRGLSLSPPYSFYVCTGPVKVTYFYSKGAFLVSWLRQLLGHVLISVGEFLDCTLQQTRFLPSTRFPSHHSILNKFLCTMQ